MTTASFFFPFVALARASRNTLYHPATAQPPSFEWPALAEPFLVLISLPNASGEPPGSVKDGQGRQPLTMPILEMEERQVSEPCSGPGCSLLT